ncbi:MAG: hypothetical protein R3204_13525, partial [Oceanospirillum sp.]|nr:hypothetical protein [Oceanospirillum sp.]
IRLEVNGVVSMEGRKLKLTNDLGEALKQIGNQYHLIRPMIMIDNLEYWRGDDIRLLENIRSLMRFLERRSDQVYTVVSTTTAMQQHLDQWLPFTQGFSSMINVNRSRTEEIYQAVLVRHGAAHKELVATNGQPLTARQIEKEVKDLCRALDHNIGEVLLAWTYNTIAEQSNIVYEPTKLSLEDFFSWHEITLLKYLILYRTIDEVTVKQLFGIRSAPYMSGLKKLINTKVLLREENGQLKLNPVILKDIRDLLKYRGILD